MTPPVFPHEIQQRIARVRDYHRASGLTDSPRAKRAQFTQNFVSDLFPDASTIALPKSLLDAPVSVLAALQEGVDAAPDSIRRPPHDLHTLATWLYFGGGTTEIKDDLGHALRTCPGEDATDPCELYVAAFRVKDLAPGLYHFSSSDFSLRRLRDGASTLRQLQRGRPDLRLLSDLPAALIVSSICCRSSGRFGLRGYRAGVFGVGRIVQNFVTAGHGLGMQTMPRLRLVDATARELIGLAPRCPYHELEHVHGLILWADHAGPDAPALVTAPAGDAPVGMPAIARNAPPGEVVSFGSIQTVHEDCVAPGVATRDIREPHTELSPVVASAKMQQFDAPTDWPESRDVRHVLLAPRPPAPVPRTAISRDVLTAVSRVTFRGGSVFPIFPSGPHLGLVRPFWVIHDVTGMEPGIWYHNPINNGWCLMIGGEHRIESKYLTLDREAFGNAAAVCWMVLNLSKLMTCAGPDLYRLAHLEAGLATRRIELAAEALGAQAHFTSEFFDEEARRFLGLEKTNWEVIAAVAVGSVDRSTQADRTEGLISM